jgi:hypothetical protein
VARQNKQKQSGRGPNPGVGHDKFCFSFWSHTRVRRLSLRADQCGQRGDPAQHAFGAGTPWPRSMGRGGEARPIATRVRGPKISLVDRCHTQCLPRCQNGFQSFDLPLAVSAPPISPSPPEAWLWRPVKHKVGRWDRPRLDFRYTIDPHDSLASLRNQSRPSQASGSVSVSSQGVKETDV